MGWTVSSRKVYRTAVEFRAEPMNTVGHWTQEQEDSLPRRRHELGTVAINTLRSPDLPDLAIQQRGPCPASAIQTGAQLSNHLEIAFLPDTHVIQVAVGDISQSGADQTLNAYIAAAMAKISLIGPPELTIFGGRLRLRTSDHRQEVFTLLGAAGGVFATIIAGLIMRRSNSPLQPDSSS